MKTSGGSSYSTTTRTYSPTYSPTPQTFSSSSTTNGKKKKCLPGYHYDASLNNKDKCVRDVKN